MLKNPIIKAFIYLLLFSSIAFIAIFLITIITILVKNSIGTLNFDFIFSAPKNGMTEGGIFPIIIGTLMVTMVSALLSIPLGIFCAIYLSEYAEDNFYTNLIRISIRNLAAVPSIVYGLFGLAIFVKTLSLGTSALSAGLTLGLLTLPTIITTAEEALKTVPSALKQAGYSLGLTDWQVLIKTTLPIAIPGILTGIILGISRAMGETAPILFTGVAFYIPNLSMDITSQFMALPYHLYIMSTQHHDIEGVKGIAYSTASVLLLLTLLLNIVSSTLRMKYRKDLKP
jgi:phosphate transport system permease protein